MCSSVLELEELEGCGGQRAVEMEEQRAELPPRKMGELHHKNILVAPLCCWLLNWLIIA